MKKTPIDIIILHMRTKNHDQMIYGSWDMVHDTCNCYFSFLGYFLHFYPPFRPPVGGGVHWKGNKNRQGQGGRSMCVHWLFLLFLKKNCEIFKIKFYIYSPVFPIDMAVWNIEQTNMKDYNIQSCQWMARDIFHQPTQDHQCGLC